MKTFFGSISIVFFICISISIYSEEIKYTYYIEWNEVKGNNGYKLEIRKPSAPDFPVREDKVSVNNLEFSIPAGEYEFRISALNRFGKPSSWSQWSRFSVEHDRPKSVVEAEKRKEIAGGISPSAWKVWVPGLSPLEKKEYGRVSFVLIWFGTLAVAANAERTAGNSLAESTTNDPGFLTLSAFAAPLPVSLYLLHKREEDKKEYDRHQNNQTVIGVLAILSYGLNVWLEKRSFHSTTVLIESKPESYSRWNDPFVQTVNSNGLGYLGRIEVGFRKGFD
ncbi:fibronectin type III domain-containing protein [Leptospira gomenensis]|uniref:fibronectin type III domain-containing protein n=1 Tax=Leptospira gomenensis TaxID=2484974 RepID=UPI003CCC6877